MPFSSYLIFAWYMASNFIFGMFELKRRALCSLVCDFHIMQMHQGKAQTVRVLYLRKFALVSDASYHTAFPFLGYGSLKIFCMLVEL